MGMTQMDEKRQFALDMHKKWQGKIEIASRVPLANKEDLAVAYTPGVAEPCLVIKDDVDASYTYTRRGNFVAVVTDGTAVLGLGDIGPEAGMPVMEGKCVLFKMLGGVDAFPLCIRSKDTDEIVKAVSLIAGSFGGINLEDIAAPRCFEIERRLKATLDIPVFHDDQHGTAVVVLAGLLNALKVVHKSLDAIKVVFSGSGAAGVATAKLLVAAGMKRFIMCDSKGTAYKGRDRMSADLAALCEIANQEMLKGTLADALCGADVFIGVSAPGLVTPDMVHSMNTNAILFPMANPVGEIMPDVAKEAGATVVGSGRSDFPNQINNVLAFPGIFRGALDVRASDINEEMKVAAAYAIASLVSSAELSPSYIIPDALDKRVAPAVAKAVANAAHNSGVARI
jgi:malate dehydrogenase (oxaloacetate-decarboxylating)